MSLDFTIDDKYAWVLLAGVSVGWLTLWQGINVSRYRKAAKIVYPQLYAEKSEAAASTDAYKFNCAQRAHQNTLETVPQALFLLAVAGLKQPIAAASLCGLWVVARVLYTLEYSAGGPAKRYRGAVLGHVGHLGLLGLATYTAGRLVLVTLNCI
ncbi:membrane-associated proteins in eicosanoid and glutathione metabolism [Hysterangium stoloniferum]|nr:membrane-associated proteins in eicosanoid and glutathione metabolism [Hysterangium stoloniferum]